MTPDIILILSILTIAVVLLVTEWIPMEVTALLSLGAVALTGLAVMFSGIVFMTFIGRHFLPQRDVAKETTDRKKIDWQSQFGLQEHLFQVRVPRDSILVQKTLAQIRMGSVLGWNVIGITRGDRTLLAPGPSDPLQAGDLLTVEGRIENLNKLANWHQLTIKPGGYRFGDYLKVGGLFYH